MKEYVVKLYKYAVCMSLCDTAVTTHDDVIARVCCRARATVDDCLSHPWINVSSQQPLL